MESIMSLQDKLKEAEARFSQNDADRMAIFKVVEGIESEIAGLKKQIAEKAKSKLRHGDCVQLHTGGFYFINDKHGCNPASERPFGIGSTGGGQINIDADRHKPVVLFNSYDLAKALQEDVESFESECLFRSQDSVSFDSPNVESFRITIKTDSGSSKKVRVSFRDILKLRQMQATQLRKEASK
jgi:hypothetical protein